MTFTTEIENLLAELRDKNREVLLAGDYNINLLQLETREAYEDFFDNMLSNGFYPKITLPTRLDRNTCTLIDNVYFKLSPMILESMAGIIFTRISDHLPYFISVPIESRTPLGKTEKYVKQRVCNRETYGALPLVNLCLLIWQRCWIQILMGIQIGISTIFTIILWN